MEKSEVIGIEWNYVIVANWEIYNKFATTIKISSIEHLLNKKKTQKRYQAENVWANNNRIAH